MLYEAKQSKEAGMLEVKVKGIRLCVDTCH